mgnify:FL=1
MIFAAAACSLERSLGDYFTCFVTERYLLEKGSASSPSLESLAAESPEKEKAAERTPKKGRAQRNNDNSNNKAKTSEKASPIPICPRILRDLLLTPELTQLLGADVVRFPPLAPLNILLYFNSLTSFIF